jgi:hypothetical protein
MFGDTNTMITLWNYSASTQDLTLTLHYAGGSYDVPVHLEPGADLDLDVVSLSRSGVPDAHGTTWNEFGRVRQRYCITAYVAGEFDLFRY